ncbi:hypothetical protein EX895_001864 [Sporisorium graminicola]|uniref:Enoyl reductase (ER) domain-containing protein n=1 Tax=Sporisorium graminicola TaxID=280036 RepID=A0A4U7KXC7_9BASI|nr:hypothetical protein EX895_001864 [Sporisorium graminicola]TKY89333.1 hypothetical protein EX895_001864 [Sporisorium graminicola]
MIEKSAAFRGAVACNPKDWKLALDGLYEGIEGNDIAGYIEAVGSEVKNLKKGDRVIAFTRMASGDQYGAYQQYTVAPAWTTAKFNEKISLVDGATLPLAVTTAFIGLFDKLCLPEPSSDSRPAGGTDKINLLVWGASSSVGAYVTQLARIAGFNIVAVAGAAQIAVHELGMDGNKSSTTETIAPESFGERWFKTVTRWVEEGKLKPNKVLILEGGIDGIPAGLKLLEENKVSNRKLFARIADTKPSIATAKI